MIDHRASGNPMYFSMRETAIVRGQEEFGEHAFAQQFRSGLSNGINDVLTELDLSRMERRDATAAFEAALGSGIERRDDLNDGVPKESAKGWIASYLERKDLEDAGIEWAVGAALADVARRNLKHPIVPQIAIGFCYGDVSRAAFLDSFCVNFEESEKQAFEACCDAIASHVFTNPGQYTYAGDAARFVAAMNGWRKSPSLNDLWYYGAWSHFNFNPEPLVIFEVQYTLDPQAALRIIEKTECPNAVEFVIMNSNIRYDFQEILRLIPLAPICFERMKEGKIDWNRGLTGPLLLSCAIQHIQDIADYEYNAARNHDRELDRDKITAELIQFSEQLAHSVLKRDDGLYLLSAWLVFLCGRNDGGKRGMMDIGRVVLSTLARLMARETKNTDHFEVMYPEFSQQDVDELLFMAVSGKGDLGSFRKLTGMSVFLAGASIAGHQGYPNLIGDIGLFRSLLIRQDNGARGYSTAIDDVAFRIIADMLSASQEPSEVWQSLWDDLTEQRRRSSLRWIEDDWQGIDPSQYLLFAGLALLKKNIQDQSEDHERLLSLWDRLWAALFELQRNGGVSNEQSYKLKFVHLFEMLATLQSFSKTNDRSSGDIVERLMTLGGDDELWVLALSALKHGQLDVLCLAESVHLAKGISCLKIVNRQFERLSARNARPDDMVVNACRELSAVLPETPISVPGS